VFALGAAGKDSPAAPPRTEEEADPDAIYARDQSFLPLPHGPRAPGVALSRPHDASEDPRHADALALLFSALPRADPKRLFAFRCGFGGAALAGLLLFPEARAVAQERDLLDAAFLSRNARALGVAARLEVRCALFPAEAARGETFPLVVGELSPSAGDAVTAREVKEARSLVARKGQALLLAPKKSGAAIARAEAGFTRLIERGSFTVWRG
jgi:hypothetical protein